MKLPVIQTQITTLSVCSTSKVTPPHDSNEHSRSLSQSQAELRLSQPAFLPTPNTAISVAVSSFLGTP